MTLGFKITNKPSSTSRLQLMDLPDEVLEIIVQNLDVRTLSCVADTHPRLRAICKILPWFKRIETTVVGNTLMELISAKPSRVRALNLSHCWSDSALMRDFILWCPQLEELNVANSSLELSHLLTALGALTKLKNLSVSITETSSDISLGLYPSVRTIYVEFTTSVEDIRSAMRVLEACRGVTDLHMNVKERSRGEYMEDPGRLSGDLCRNYQSITVSSTAKGSPTLRKVICDIFRNDAAISNYFWHHVSTGNICWYERNGSGGERPMMQHASPATLDHRYQELHLSDADLSSLSDVYRQGQLGLRIVFPSNTMYAVPELSPLSALRELDFRRCHALYTPASWESLARSSPAVEILALPPCAVMEAGPEKTMEALAELKLRKLHVESTADNCCPRCVYHELGGAFTKGLSGLRHLEELTLSGRGVEDCFLDSLEESCSVKTMKIILSGSLNVDELGKFLGRCGNLRNLTLHASTEGGWNCDLLWGALSAACLSTLCVSIPDVSSIDTQRLRTRVLHLCETLDVFHLHRINAHNFEKVHSVLKDTAQEANLLRGENPLQLVVTRGTRPLCYPGRSLCSSTSFVATVKPVGWYSEVENHVEPNVVLGSK